MRAGMEPATLRERLARDIFLADNSSIPEDEVLADWDALRKSSQSGKTYAHGIADGLIAKGWRRVQWAA